jgi:8-oxo-dGTP pyrophosphatase MutT (NUDIX family)
MTPTIHFYATGGGVVLNQRHQILLLERHVQRDGVLRREVRLPKGKIELDESPVQAAFREVCEESGYCELALIAPLGDALVPYTHRNAPYMRREFYFLFRLVSDVPPTPNPQGAEEALFQPRWASNFAAAMDLLTYSAEQSVMHRAFIHYTTLPI